MHTQEDLTRVRNRIEQLCQSGNIKVSSIATDLFGKSGRSMLKALVKGKRDACWLADYARRTLRNKKHELELRAGGHLHTEQRWLLNRDLLTMEGLAQHVASMVSCLLAERASLAWKQRLRSGWLVAANNLGV
jgi:hypothetical protein